MLATLLLFSALCTQDQRAWTPQGLEEVLRTGGVKAQEVDGLANWFGGLDKLKNGADAKVSELYVAWGIEVPSGVTDVSVRSLEPNEPPFNLVLQRAGNGQLFVGAKKLPEAEGFRWQYFVNGNPVGGQRDLEVYTRPPESFAGPDLKPGKLERQPPLESKVFGGTKHDWWVYTPTGFDPSVESNLVVFQDGQWSHDYAPVYFDNLIAERKLPQTVALFVTPGTFPDGKSDRSREYDTLNDSYVRFLLEELLPPVENKFKITQDPMRRCVAGLSSGGICSFTSAWQRPDKFGLVMSWIGSFTNIASGESLREGGHNYPALIRKTPKKPIRVFLQDGENDLDNVHGNWFLSNKQMAKALVFAKYDVKAVWGKGFHSDKQGRATMTDALLWLFNSR